MGAEKRSISEKSEVLHGISVSPGIVVGKAKVIRRRARRAGWYRLSRSQIAREVTRFRKAVARAEEDLIGLRNQFADDLADALSIIDSHILMIRDRMIMERTIDIIREQMVNAEWALAQALDNIKKKFEAIADPYIKARYADVKYAADRVFTIMSGEEDDPLADIGEQVIVVAHDFSPEDTMRMRSDRILGFIAEAGGVTSHTAIVARSLGIPAVVGLEQITRQCVTGDSIILDGYAGRVYLHPTLDQQLQYREYRRQHQAFTDEIALYIHLSPETMDGRRVRLAANIETASGTRSCRSNMGPRASGSFAASLTISPARAFRTRNRCTGPTAGCSRPWILCRSLSAPWMWAATSSWTASLGSILRHRPGTQSGPGASIHPFFPAGAGNISDSAPGHAPGLGARVLADPFSHDFLSGRAGTGPWPCWSGSGPA